MLVQIVSGRMLAPFVGTSVYAWTGVIGTTLAGLVFGSAAGGYLADRVASRGTLGKILIVSGACALSAYALVLLAGLYMGAGSMPLLARVIVMSFGGFFPTAFFLSMVTPLAAKLSVDKVGDAGRITGRLTAASSLGNILGVLSGGYLLISLVGTKMILLAITLVLVGLGFWLMADRRPWMSRWAWLGTVLFIGAVLLPNACQIETAYYCVRIFQTQNKEGAPVQVLRLDHLVHSYVNPANPFDLGYGYERVYAQVIADRFATSTSFSALFIGGGGYVLPRYLEAAYPNATSIVAEIDPGVTEVNHAYLGLPATTTIVTANEDARQHLVRGGDPPYDLVFGDAFNDFTVPAHLTTVEFHQLLKSRMKPDGVYAMNIIDDPRYGRFLASMVRTLSAVWKHVEVDAQADALVPGRNTIVLLASDEPIPTSTLQFIPHDDVQAFLAEHPTPLLTDDFAPTDRYLAPVFKDAY